MKNLKTFFIFIETQNMIVLFLLFNKYIKYEYLKCEIKVCVKITLGILNF